MDENSETTLSIDAENKDDTNSAILSIFQDSTRFETAQEYFEHNLIHTVVFQHIDNPSFDYLRTKAQLGYIAYARSFVYRDVIAGGFIVQSAVKSPEYVFSKCNDFLEIYKEKLDSLTDEDYETTVKAVIMNKKEIDNSLLQETFRLFTRIEKHTYDFDYKEKQIEYLEKMINKEDLEFYNKSKKAVVNHYNQLFFGKSEGNSGPRIINIELISNQHKEENEESYTENKEKYKREKRKIIDVSQISKFKNGSVLYPDNMHSRFANYSTE